MCFCIAASIMRAAPGVFGPQFLQMRVEAAVGEQPCHRELNQVLGVWIETLFDQRDLIDDRGGCRQPAETQARRKNLREAVQMNHEILCVDLV